MNKATTETIVAIITMIEKQAEIATTLMPLYLISYRLIMLLSINGVNWEFNNSIDWSHINIFSKEVLIRVNWGHTEEIRYNIIKSNQEQR